MFVAFGIVILIIFAIYVGIGVAVNHIAVRVPDAVEAKYFGAMGASLMHSEEASKVDLAGSMEKELKFAQEIFSKLIQVPGQRNLPFKLYYLNQDSPNAFAAPGGAVAVTKGLLKMVKSEGGLAMVLAHELGHHAHRDPLRGMGRQIALSAFVTLAFGKNENLSGSILNLAEASHSRSQELLADAYGMELVFKVLGNAQGALEFYEEVEKNPETKSTKGLTFLSSHPYTPDRAKALLRLQRRFEVKFKKK